MNSRARLRRRPLAMVVASIVLIGSACGSDDVTSDVSEAPDDPVAAAEQRVSDAEEEVTDAQEALTSAHGDFCGATEDYIEILDRYGRVFIDRAATVGDITTLGADLVEPRDSVVAANADVDAAKDELTAAQQELADAEAALLEAIAVASSLPTTDVEPTTVTTTTLVPPATIEALQRAEDDLARTGEDITDDTPLVEAAADYNSAALALEMSWLRLLDDAACLTDDQQATAAEQIAAYTTALQTDLTTAGYDPGEIDGIYGPKTVEAVEQLQTDSELPVTGFVDEATARALDAKLVAAGHDQARQTVILQTILSLVGYWDGPIDGVWSEDLTRALMDFQTALGVEPTGVVDAATISAFQIAVANLQTGTSTTVPDAPTETTDAPADGLQPTVLVAESELGEILTTGDGLTVYVFLSDDRGAPTCVGDCADTWPPLTIDDAAELAGGDGVDATLLDAVEHPDGGLQVTYDDWPLYSYSGDADPGDVTGQGQGGVWYVIDPAGAPIVD